MGLIENLFKMLPEKRVILGYKKIQIVNELNQCYQKIINKGCFY